MPSTIHRQPRESWAGGYTFILSFIFDFPIFSALQVFYLSLQGKSACEGYDTTFSINNISDHELLGDAIKKNIIDNSLFIANWSLTESPLSFRKKIHPFLSKFDNVLIAFKDTFEEVNNIEYIETFKKIFEHEMKWISYEMPFQPGNYYLIGTKN